MKIVMVSFYPPQRGRLSEYADYLSEALGETEDVEVLAQEIPEPEDVGNVQVEGAFDRNNPTSILKVARKVKAREPDVVLFNQYFGVWGEKYSSNLAGVSLPLLVNLLSDIPTVTVLHHVYEELDVKEISRAPPAPVTRAGLWTATRLLLRSDAVAVTMEHYRNILENKYGASNVVHISHGSPSGEMDFEEAPSQFTVLALGHWGPEKNLEGLVEGVQRVPGDTRLRVAGASHPDYPEHLEKLEEKYSNEDVEFLGYLPNSQLPGLFRSADVLVLPYSTTTGTSGVYNLAKGYGVPVIATRGAGFELVEEEEGGEMVFADPTPEDLGEKISRLREDTGERRRLAEKNFEAGRETSFENVAERYLSLFEELRR